MMILKPPPANPPVLPGVTDMMTLYRALVERPDAVKSFLAEWESYLKRYEEVISGYGGAQKIVTLQASLEQQENEAKKRSAEAAEALTAARQKAAEIAAMAEHEAVALRAALGEREQKILRLGQEAEARIAARETAVMARETAVEKAEAALANKLAGVEAREQAVAKRIEKMAAAGIKIEL